MIKLEHKLLQFFVTVCFVLQSGSLIAVPAKPTPINVIQPNGSELTILVEGDEYFHFEKTVDGFTLVKETDGGYYYAITDNNNLISSGVLAQNHNQRTTAENFFLSTIDQKSIKSALFSQPINPRLRARTNNKPPFRLGKYPATGSNKVLVVLVEFNDLSFSIENPKQAFHNLLNEEGYSVNGATGSALDYFIDNSMNKFRPEFDVYGPVKVSKNTAYYGAQVSALVNDQNPREMVLEACAILAEQGVDFSDYDVDSDGLVDNIYVLYAGHGQADQPANTDAIWPHSWNVLEFDVSYNGATLNTYACSGELLGGTNQITGIGTFVHEFCHVLGLPDLYATRSNIDAFTPGTWSVLASGPYNNSQKTPPNMSAYERFFLGWLDPVELNTAVNISVEAVDMNKGYVIKTNKPNEYYILENRQPKGWDTYIPGHGMLVWHIDYDEEIWESNIVNNEPERQRVDIVEADNTKTNSSRDGDVFPGVTNVTSFTDATTPSMKTWAGVALNKPINSIKEENGIVSFRFMGGKNVSGSVTLKPAENVTQTSFVVSWNEIQNATFYVLSVYEKRDDSSVWYVGEYKDKVLGNLLSYEVTGLNPETQYYYVVKAADAFSETEYSQEASVTTSDATFEFLAPVATDATSVDVNSFVANWEPMQDATSYTLTVYKKNYSDPMDSETLDFTGGINAIPATWSTDCNAIFGSTGFFGQSKPALRFNADKRFIRTPSYENGISGLSFWYRGSNSTDDNSIVVKGHIGANRQTIHTVSPIINEEGQTISLNLDQLEGCKAVTIEFSRKGSGDLALDDIVVETGGRINKDVLEGYNELNVGNNISFKVDGLANNEYYYYTISGSNGNISSKSSNEIKVYTQNLNSITPGFDDVRQEVRVGKDYIYIKSTEKVLSRVAVYSLAGQVVYSGTFGNESYIPTQMMSAGIYFVKINETTHKIIIKIG